MSHFYLKIFLIAKQNIQINVEVFMYPAFLPVTKYPSEKIKRRKGIWKKKKKKGKKLPFKAPEKTQIKNCC